MALYEDQRFNALRIVSDLGELASESDVDHPIRERFDPRGRACLRIQRERKSADDTVVRRAH